MTTALATTKMRVHCRAKERQDSFEADIVPDLTVAELIDGLNAEGYLPALASGERWRVLNARTGTDLTPNARLDQSGVMDGDQLELMRDSHGAHRSRCRAC